MDDVPDVKAAFTLYNNIPKGNYRVDAIHYNGEEGYTTFSREATVTFPMGWGANTTHPNEASDEHKSTVLVDFEEEDTKGNLPFAKRRMFMCSTNAVKPTTPFPITTPVTSTPGPMMCPLNQEESGFEWTTTEGESCIM